MQKFIKWFFILTVLRMCAFSLSAFDLVKNANAVVVVYLMEGEGVPEAYAALPKSAPRAQQKSPMQQTYNQALFDLKNYVKKISGAELEYRFVRTADPISIPAIILGKLALGKGLQPPPSDERGEGFAIRVEENRLLIAGSSPYGTAWGIYELLRQIGVDWVMPGEIGEIYPQSRNITFSSPSLQQIPSFRMRAPWLHGGLKIATREERTEFARWQIRHREQIDRKLYGEEFAAGGHLWGVFKNRRFDHYFSEHPEIAALRVSSDGSSQRIRHQIDCTNPHAIAMLEDYIRNQFLANHWPSDKRVALSIGPADGDGFDEGEASKQLCWRYDPITGEQDLTDMLVKLGNDLLDKLLPEFPNLHLGFFSYHTYADFPGKYPPSRNFAIQVADITPSRFHGICDSKISPSRAYYKQVLEKWAATGTKIVFWHYNWNLAEAILPYSKLRIIGEDMPYEHRLGAIGYGDEYTQQLSVTAPHDYLQARLMWDVTLNWKEITMEFCQKAYGKGCKPMFDYYMMLCDSQANSPDESGSFIPFGRMYSREDAEKMAELLTLAGTLAEAEQQKIRVKIAFYPVKQLLRYLDFYEASIEFRFAEAWRAVQQMQAAYEEEKNSAYPQGVSRWSDSFMRAFLQNFAEAAVKYTSVDYDLVCPLPERMKFVYDVDGAGKHLGLWSPQINDTEFPELSTYRSTLSRQGGIGLRRGSIWYRSKIELPKIVTESIEQQASEKTTVEKGGLILKQNEGIGIFLGGFDNEAEIWVNGKCAGSVSGFLRPGVLDITALVFKNGEPNSIVICVTRNGNSEAATGGLIYPSFLFKGPRISAEEKNGPGGFQIKIPGQVYP